jgi:hypothetical protein
MTELINPPDDDVAVYISGGIDSAIVLHHVCEKLDPEQVHTDTAKFGTQGDELAKAQQVADYFGTNHTVVPLDNFLSTLPEIMKLLDQPRYNVWPYWLARAAAFDGVKTAYIGEGSDEIFGYPDRGYLEGWAGQLIYIRPMYETVNWHFSITLKAPFLDLQNHLVATYGQIMPITYYQPPMKEILRLTYADILPDWILTTPTTPPGFTCYQELCKNLGLTGNPRRALQLAVTKAWLEVHTNV